MSESSVSPFPSAAPKHVPADALSRSHADFGPMAGFLVVDVRGRVAGRVVRAPRGIAGESPGALAVRSGLLRVRRYRLPADAIEQIDGRSKVLCLRIDRKTLRTGRL